MDLKTKAVISVLPYLVAGYVGAMLAAPAVQFSNEKAEALATKRQENEDLESKLTAKAKFQAEKKKLEEEINKLRASVPHTADKEILNIDLEKMCLDSGVEMIAFKQPDAQSLEKMGIKEDDKLEAPSMQKGKEALANRVKSQVGAAAPGGKKDDKPAIEPDGGLSKLTLQIKATGDYVSLMNLTKKLETYQRVIGIQQIESSIPKKTDTKGAKNELPEDSAPAENDNLGDPKRLNISFLLTAYYLP